MSRRLGWLLAALAVISIFVGRPLAPWVGFGLALAACLAVDRRALRVVFRLGLLLAILFSSAVAGAAVVWSSDWSSGLQAAAAMLLRLLVLAIITALLTRNIDAEAMLRAGEKLGMDRLGLTLGLALNVMPQLVEATRHVVMAWRVRRRSAQARAPSVLQLLEVLLAHVARIADEAAAAAALRGHAALLQRPVVVAAATPVVVATGPPGGGKTTSVEALIHDLRFRGIRAVGILQPGRFHEGRKVGFGIRDVLTGEEAALARLVTRDEGDHGTRFQFSDEGFALARRAMARTRADDVLVVDELGPLELRGQGHMPAVERALAVPGLAGVVIVVRSQLVPALLAALEVDDALVVDVTTTDGTARLLRGIRPRPDTSDR